MGGRCGRPDGSPPRRIRRHRCRHPVPPDRGRPVPRATGRATTGSPPHSCSRPCRHTDLDRDLWWAAAVRSWESDWDLSALRLSGSASWWSAWWSSVWSAWWWSAWWLSARGVGRGVGLGRRLVAVAASPSSPSPGVGSTSPPGFGSSGFGSSGFCSSGLPSSGLWSPGFWSRGLPSSGFFSPGRDPLRRSPRCRPWFRRDSRDCPRRVRDWQTPALRPGLQRTGQRLRSRSPRRSAHANPLCTTLHRVADGLIDDRVIVAQTRAVVCCGFKLPAAGTRPRGRAPGR